MNAAYAAPHHEDHQRHAKYRLHLSAKGLRDADFRGKSDPKAYVELDDPMNRRRELLGHTETVPETLNPEWADEVVVDFVFGDTRALVFRVVDVDPGKEDDLGEARVQLSTLVQRGHADLKLSQRGTLSVTAVLVEDNNERLDFEFFGEGLAKKDFFSQSDAFLTFRYRVLTDGGASRPLVFHKTEVVPSNKNPRWRPFRMSAAEFCNSDDDLEIEVECADYDDDGSSDLIGVFTTTLGKIKAGARAFELRHPKKKKKAQGVVRLHHFRAEVVPRFEEFAGVLKIETTYHVDFTASNNEYGFHDAGRQQTPYEEAVERLHEVLGVYDPQFSFHGFGARFPGMQSTSFDTDFGEMDYAAFVARYREVLRGTKLSGPTRFAPILRNVLKGVHHIPRNAFHLHVIFTDGKIVDTDEVKALLRQLGPYRVFVLIIGIGRGDKVGGFGQMADLDDLDEDEADAGAVDKTDFVAADMYPTAHAFRLKVLAEVPKAVEDAMRVAGLRPQDLGAPAASAPPPAYI